MIIIFTDTKIAGYVVRQNDTRCLVSIPASGLCYGYVYKHDLQYVTHGAIISNQDIFLAHSSVFKPIRATSLPDLPEEYKAVKGQPMLTITIEPDAFLWLYAEIYNNGGDPYYLNAIDDSGTRFVYTGPAMEEIELLIKNQSWFVNTHLEKDE